MRACNHVQGLVSTVEGAISPAYMSTSLRLTLIFLVLPGKFPDKFPKSITLLLLRTCLYLHAAPELHAPLWKAKHTPGVRLLLARAGLGPCAEESRIARPSASATAARYRGATCGVCGGGGEVS